MILHAYRITAYIKDGVDMDSQGFNTSLMAMRTAIRRQIDLMGGDPMPGQQIMLSSNAEKRTITIIWRSRSVPPDSPVLFEGVRKQSRTATDVSTWRLDYHECQNAARRRCPKWRTLIEE